MSDTKPRQAAIEVPRGLAGVVVTDTALGDVRGTEGFYHYRQYSAIELAASRSFEDVWHLMFHGTLPDAERSAAFATRVAALRHLPDEVAEQSRAKGFRNGKAFAIRCTVPPRGRCAP